LIFKRQFNKDGEESHEFRLLHVYHSSKRAANKAYKSGSDSEGNEDELPCKRRKPPTTSTRVKRQKLSNTSQRPDKPPVSSTSPRALGPALPSPPRPSPFRTVKNNNSNKENNPDIQWVADSLSLSWVTPEIHEFGRFHPIQDGENNLDVPKHPYHEFDNLQLTLDDPILPNLGGSWEDPLMPPMNEEETLIRTFADKLDQIHESLKECILTAARESEQGHLLSLVSAWARRVATSPLGDNEIKIVKV